MAKVKEIWVKFNNEESYSENEGKLFEILDKAPGDCAVKAYSTERRAVKNLAGYSFDEKQLSLLVDVFGDANVRYQEKEIEQHEPEKVKTPKIRQIIPCNDTLYAVMTGTDGAEYKRKVLMYALCDDGEVYPLYFDSEFGVSPLYDAVFDVDRYEMQEGAIM